MSKTVLITGASRGIGKAIAIAFAENGYNVVINYLNSCGKAAELHDYLSSMGYSALLCRADVADPVQVEKMASDALSRFGSVDVLVNNAALWEQGLFCDVLREKWTRMLDVNLNGAMNCIKEILPSMIRRKSGNIINISSVWGIAGASYEVHYSVTKAALIGLTKSLAKEVAPSGIRVNCIAPGVIDTDMNAGFSAEDMKNIIENIPLGKMGTPSDVAELALFLAGENAGYITGQVITVDGGMII